MTYQLSNKGNPFSVSDSSCGYRGLKIYFSPYLDPHIVNAEKIIEQKQIGLVFKKTVEAPALKVTYSNKGKLYSMNIYYEDREDIYAITIEALLKRKIDEINTERGLQKKRVDAVSKAFGLDRKDETVKVYFDDGTFEEYKTYNTKVANAEWCLVADGGKTYHLRYGCFHKWPEEYQKNFVAWKAMKLKNAISQGYTLCKHCEKADGPLSFDENDEDEQE